MAGVALPKARQIYLVLRERIASGHVASGEPLPGEQALAAEHRVSRITVRRALAALEDEGLIRRRQGAGTFVQAPITPKPVVADLSDVLANLAAMGRSTAVKLLAFGYQDAPPAVAEALELPAGEEIQRSVRVRIIDGAPFSYLVTHVPARIGRTYSEAELAATPLLSLLERTGVRVDRATQEIGAVLATPEVAAALCTDVGAALLSLTRVVFDVDGRGVEHLSALYRPDRYAFRMDLVRTGQADRRRWSPAGGGEEPVRTTRAARPTSTARRGRTPAQRGDRP